MSWKTETRLSDLDPETRIEVACRACGLTRYETPRVLMVRSDLRSATLDLVERRLACADRRCGGGVRLALIHDDRTEPFVGGMA